MRCTLTCATISMVLALAGSQERAVGGGLLGAGAGAAVGGLAGGGRGAGTGALIGGGVGAVGGALTTPQRPYYSGY